MRHPTPTSATPRVVPPTTHLAVVHRRTGPRAGLVHDGEGPGLRLRGVAILALAHGPLARRVLGVAHRVVGPRPGGPRRAAAVPGPGGFATRHRSTVASGAGTRGTTGAVGVRVAHSRCASRQGDADADRAYDQASRTADGAHHHGLWTAEGSYDLAAGGARRTQCRDLTGRPIQRLRRTTKRPAQGGALQRNSGGDLLSQALASQVPSALRGLTALFGKGRGVSPSP